jgi:outer membrane protein W
MIIMISNANKTIAYLAALIFLPLTANAYHTNLVKGRLGYINIERSGSGTKTLFPKQKINGGAIGEVALTRFVTSNIAAEIGLGCAFVRTKSNADTSKKNSHIIPLNAALQFHLPIRNTVVPYVGIGYAYNIFQHTSTKFKIKKSGDLLYQVGMDVFILDHVGFNLDVKYSKIKHKLSDNGVASKVDFKNLTTMAGITIPF